MKARLLFLLMLIIFVPAQALALSANQRQVFDEGILFFNTDDYNPTSCSAGGGSPDTSANAKTFFDYFLGKGLGAQQTAALAGNAKIESGFDPTAYYPGSHTSDPDPSTAFGLIQWKGGRQTSLRDLANSRNLPITDLGTQLDFIWQELNGPYKSAVLDPLNAASDLATMVDIVNNHYEVSGSSSQPRLDAAQADLSQFGSDAPAGSLPGGITSSCGGSAAASTTSCSVNQPTFSGEYSQQQLTQIFGDPGTATSHPQMDANLVTVNFLGISAQVNKLVAPCLNAVANDIQSSGVSYKLKDFGCYRFDSNNGSSNIGLRSYHTYGAACDVNPYTNNFMRAGTTLPYNANCPPVASVTNSQTCYDMPPEYIKAFRDHGFTWGGSWQSPKDYMHFEFNGIQPPGS